MKFADKKNLVDFDEFKSRRQCNKKNVYVHEDNDELYRADPIERKIRELVLKLNKILKNKKLAVDSKIKIYNQTLSKFRHFESEKRTNK